MKKVLEQEMYCQYTIYFSKFQGRKNCTLATPFGFVKDEILFLDERLKINKHSLSNKKIALYKKCTN